VSAVAIGVLCDFGVLVFTVDGRLMVVFPAGLCVCVCSDDLIFLGG